MPKLTEPSDQSETRSLSAGELDLISGGDTHVNFGGGVSWTIHDNGVTLRIGSDVYHYLNV